MIVGVLAGMTLEVDVALYIVVDVEGDVWIGNRIGDCIRFELNVHSMIEELRFLMVCQ